jgi:DNA-binding HxlR family transcriptional regulator
MKPYGQYCPISRSAEVLGERWVIHIVRDLLTGSTRFNELIRGNPGLSRPLLSRRLRQLQTAGVILQAPDGTYRLTDAGRDLEPVVFGMAAWAARWMFGEPAEEELDPDLLVWWLHRQMDTTNIPGEHFTVYVPFSDHAKRYWIVVDHEASLCLSDPGFEVDVVLRTDRASLYRTYLGHTSLDDAYRTGTIGIEGSRHAVRAFFEAFRQSPVAGLVAAEAAPHG